MTQLSLLFPNGEVPFKKNEVPIGTDHTSLRREYKNLYHFVKGGNDSLSLSVERLCLFNYLKDYILKRQRLFA